MLFAVAQRETGGWLCPACPEFRPTQAEGKIMTGKRAKKASAPLWPQYPYLTSIHVESVQAGSHGAEFRFQRVIFKIEFVLPGNEINELKPPISIPRAI